MMAPTNGSKRGATGTTPPTTGTTSLLRSQDGLLYHRGFSNHVESESVPGTLPLGRNNPRLVPGRLYSEQLSGTAFTSPRCDNRRSWLYRIRPGVSGTSSGFVPCGTGGTGGAGDGTTDAGDEGRRGAAGLPRHFGRCDWSRSSSSSSSSGGGRGDDYGGLRLDPNPMRWGPVPLPSEDFDADADGRGPRDFIEGMRTMAGCGDPTTRDGVAIYVYSFDTDMTGRQHSGGGAAAAKDRHMYNSDGDMLLVPQSGSLDITTEMGRMIVHPKEVCVLPRGVVFSVNVHKNGSAGQDEARGYALEIFRGHFALPELGPVGSNGLANVRDFLVPAARYVSDPLEADRPCRIINKFGNELFERISPHTPYNVVSWHGNYGPYKYDLTKFCAVNSVTFDHVDPSIYTVLTAKSDQEGTALADFVIFPPRMMATDEDTFRPPWFHRNVMSEFMGLIYGEYDAKSSSNGNDKEEKSGKKKGGGGFKPGGASLHNTMTPHGPDAQTYRKAVADPCDSPKKFEGGMAFMFETCLTLKCSQYALSCGHREGEYAGCWDGLDDEFTGWMMKEREGGTENGGQQEGGKDKDKAPEKKSGDKEEETERETKRARI